MSKPKKQSVAVLEPGKEPYLLNDVDAFDTWEKLCPDTDVESYHLPNGAWLYMDENGKQKDLPPNVVGFVGTLFYFFERKKLKQSDMPYLKDTIAAQWYERELQHAEWIRKMKAAGATVVSI